MYRNYKNIRVFAIANQDRTTANNGRTVKPGSWVDKWVHYRLTGKQADRDCIASAARSRIDRIFSSFDGAEKEKACMLLESIDHEFLRRNGIHLSDQRDGEYLLMLLQDEYHKRIAETLCRGLTLEQREGLLCEKNRKRCLRRLREFIPDYSERIASVGTLFGEEIRRKRRRVVQVVLGAELDITLDELELPIRISNCLMRAGIYTVEGILSRSREEILSLRNFPQNKIGLLEEQIYRGVMFRNWIADYGKRYYTEIKY